MTRLRMVVAAGLVAVLSAGGAAFAQGPDGQPGPGGPGGRGFGGPGGRFGGGPGGPGGLPIRELNLTQAQQDQIRDIRQRHADDIRAAQDHLRKAMDAQRKLIETVPINEGAIRATTQDLAEAQTDAAIEEARLFSDTWAVLTPAQQAQVKKLEAVAAARRNAPRGRGQRPPQH